MITVPCNKGKCEYWDSDRNGGHCMLLRPDCKRVRKLIKKFGKKEKTPR